MDFDEKIREAEAVVLESMVTRCPRCWEWEIAGMYPCSCRYTAPLPPPSPVSDPAPVGRLSFLNFPRSFAFGGLGYIVFVPFRRVKEAVRRIVAVWRKVTERRG